LRNTTMLAAFVKAKVAKTADPKFVGHLVNSLQRASERRPAKAKRSGR
jgi:hypothetical protein